MYSRSAYLTITKPFMSANMAIYWCDFLLSYAVLGGSIWLWLTAPLWLSLIGLIVGALAAYRLGSFMHEIVHFDKRNAGQQLFKKGWNLMFGIPVMSPSHLYDSHLDHHRQQSFGTVEDPEYVALTDRSLLGLFKFVVHHTMSPVSLVALRLLLNPLIWLLPAIARLVGNRGTALVINWDYVPSGRQIPTLFDKAAILLSTLLLYAYITALLMGYLPLIVAAKIVLLVALGMFLNGVRTLVAHRYTNFSGQALNKEAQLADSINLIANPFFGGLFAPVGLRYHALHHLVPNLPYHNLERAHRALMATLPPEDVYRQVNIEGVGTALGQISHPPENQATILASG